MANITMQIECIRYLAIIVLAKYQLEGKIMVLDNHGEEY